MRILGAVFWRENWTILNRCEQAKQNDKKNDITLFNKFDLPIEVLLYFLDKKRKLVLLYKASSFF